jgi:uncharacterized transporter YbjL
MNTIIERMQKPTPGFFQKLRNIGLALGAIGAAIVASPVALPAFVIRLASYLIVAGTVAGAVSQTAVKNEGE